MEAKSIFEATVVITDGDGSRRESIGLRGASAYVFSAAILIADGAWRNGHYGEAHFLMNSTRVSVSAALKMIAQLDITPRSNPQELPF